MRYLPLIALTCWLMWSCEQTPKTNYKPLNLLSHGIPLTIQAPEDPEIKITDLTVMKDITIKKPPGYNIQIYSSSASTTDTKKLKDEHLEEVKNNPYFNKLIQEEQNGFIYEKQVDSTSTSYGFKYVIVQGDQEYIFQNGLLGIFSLEDIENMYRAVRQDK